MRRIGWSRREGSPPSGRREGAILAMVMVVVIVVSLLGTGLLSLSSQNALATARTLNATKAFWIAEAGVQRFDKRCINPTNRVSIGNTPYGDGSYRVDAVLTSVYAIVSATVQGETKQIRIGVAFLGKPFEQALFSGNGSIVGNTNNYIFNMRGSNNPVAYGSSGERGGRDIVYGKVYANGDVRLYEQSYVTNAIPPNTYNIRGDVDATGLIVLTNSARIYGTQSNYVAQQALPVFPDYAKICTYDVAAEFARYNITSGYLPATHPLYNVVVKNPSSRASESALTTGDDYFFEPSSGFTEGAWNNARTSLLLGENRIYYVDGHVWFNSGQTFGFKVDGKATIAATGDIHISDNLKYANTNSANGDMLGLVAVGKTNAVGVYEGGNIWFGDPKYGTVYTVDAFMFARNDFLYITWNTAGQPQEPDSGFSIFGNYGALGQINIKRDWYTSGSGARPAYYDDVAGKWKDALDYHVLTTAEANSRRHYQMIVKYDERIRNVLTQPPGLPQQPFDINNANLIYGGVVKWDLLPFNLTSP